MSNPAFLECEALSAMGIEHGFGTLASEGAEVAGLSLARQVHGTDLVEAPAPALEDREADALYTAEAGAAVGVQTADCVPLLIADSRLRGVAAVHAGWRGSAARIAERAVSEICSALRVKPGALVIAVGPHIGPCCYEVDDPVREVVGDDAVLSPRGPGHYLLDLFELNRRQLLRSGVQGERIHRVGDCTMCHPERYASYRRDGSARRMLHWIRLPARPPSVR